MGTCGDGERGVASAILQKAMTIPQAKRITGLEIEIYKPPSETPDRLIYVQGRNGTSEALWGEGGTLSEALAGLVDNNWRKVVYEVSRSQHWRCADCGKCRWLQGHHVKRRSRGRDDRKENVLALCNSCHRDLHGH